MAPEIVLAATCPNVLSGMEGFYSLRAAMLSESLDLCVCGDFRGVEDSELRQGGLLGGSWDLVTRAIIKVTTLITTYNHN